MSAARAAGRAVDGCATCTRLAGSVLRTDLLAHRAAHRALTQGLTTPFERATKAHQDAVGRLDTHVLLDHVQQQPRAAEQGRAAG